MQTNFDTYASATFGNIVTKGDIFHDKQFYQLYSKINKESVEPNDAPHKGFVK